MANWWKIISAILIACSVAFAQYDEDESTSYTSYGEEEASSEAGSAQASGDEWEGFRYEDLGLTQWEFQQAKESGMSRDKLTHLVELGVLPSEYLQKPWERLGVSEDAWLKQRSEGLEDADIDRSYRNRSGDQSYAYISLALPSFYQWKTGATTKAIWMDALWVAGAGAMTFMLVSGMESWYYFLIPVLGAHIWSFADAFFGTQWDSNPDANRFSYGVLPTPTRENAGVGVTGFFNVKF